MKTWAYSPRYWQKYMQLLSHPLARLVDLTVIKQGDKIAHQKGWVKLPREPRKAKPKRGTRAPRRRPPPAPRDRPALPVPGALTVSDRRVGISWEGGMRRRSAIGLIGGLAALAAAALVLVPAIPQDPAYHRLADSRAWLGIPNALNVLSNAGFLLVGALGLAYVADGASAPPSASRASGGRTWSSSAACS